MVYAGTYITKCRQIGEIALSVTGRLCGRRIHYAGYALHNPHNEIMHLTQ